MSGESEIDRRTVFRAMLMATLGFALVVLGGSVKKSDVGDTDGWGEVRLVGLDFDDVVLVPPEGSTIEAFFRRFPVPDGVASIGVCFKEERTRRQGVAIELGRGSPFGMPVFREYRINPGSEVRFYAEERLIR